MKTRSTYSLSDFPLGIPGIICGYKNDGEDLPSKIPEMGLLPETPFVILYQAPFSGPLYIEFGQEKSRIALRPEEAEYILVEQQEESKA
ncbi:MAG: FeoA family protein [Bergeyella sp.]